MRTSTLMEREISGIKIINHSGADRARAGPRRPSPRRLLQRNVRKSGDDLREAGDRARDRPGGYAEAPNFHLHGNSCDDQADTISESESNCSEQWYELDGQEQEALISLTDTRKRLQHATKSRRFYPRGGGRARSTGKSIDELKKVTPCNRCGAIGSLGRRLHTACQKPQEEIPSSKGKGKSRRFIRAKI